MTEYNYEGRRFVGLVNYDDGDLTRETLFSYLQKENTVWGTFEGGRIRIGTLVADVKPDGSLDMRWLYLNIDGDFRWGSCISVPEILPDGRYRLFESWTDFTAEEITGTSVIEEVRQVDQR
ncbi:MAG: n-acetylglutamate synthase [candidate division Zixibacteria bacterium]|nr:n-acetylglutamate synthase [candidate division Zixibacteria bacterium]